MSKINFVLSWVEHEKSFITSRPGNFYHISNGKSVSYTTFIYLFVYLFNVVMLVGPFEIFDQIIINYQSNLHQFKLLFNII